MAETTISGVRCVLMAWMRNIAQEQIQLIGFDDIHLASLMSPELTTIHQSVRQLADTAMEILLRSRREEKNGTRHVLPVKLIQRETTSA